MPSPALYMSLELCHAICVCVCAICACMGLLSLCVNVCVCVCILCLCAWLAVCVLKHVHVYFCIVYFIDSGQW